MNAKPFRNSKGVNKPFRSPFNTPQNHNNRSKATTLELNRNETPLRNSVVKRLLFQQTSSPKKLCLNKENGDGQINIKQKKDLYQTDLELLRKRIQEKEESINNLKTTLSYRKKNKAEDLQNAIQKWTDCCRNALKDYQKDLQGKVGREVMISEILSSFNIDPDIVHFSIDDDTFY